MPRTGKAVLVLVFLAGLHHPLPAQFTAWPAFAHDPQHTGISSTAAQPLTTIHWHTPVDLNPQSSGGDLLIHYGPPLITAANTVLVPVKTGATDNFEIQAFSGDNGNLLYTLPSDYTLPSHQWIPAYGPVLAARAGVPQASGSAPHPLESVRPAHRPTERLYFPGAGGTVYFRDQPDSLTGPTGQIAFFGNALYASNPAAFNSSVRISTPLVADAAGNIVFGFVVTGSNPAGLTSGIARISAHGVGAWTPAGTFAGSDTTINHVQLNCAPALSRDQSTLYFAVSDGAFGTGYLVSANSATLAPIARVRLLDPRGGLATVTDDSSSTPMVGPDGDVYFGVLENNCCGSHNDRGWMLHFDATLTQTKIPGSFGWDDTPSVVPSNLVPSYKGGSPYLILTKYNNYVGEGTGDGLNKLAILDPNASMQDAWSVTPVQVMREVLTIMGATPDTAAGLPGAVKEWCINTAAVDPFTKSAIVNNEDGVVYRWDFTTNTLSQSLRLTSGRGEAYTPTVIGPDGTAYAINDAILFAIGAR